jgi:hypothetical protein
VVDPSLVAERVEQLRDQAPTLFSVVYQPTEDGCNTASQLQLRYQPSAKMIAAQ